MTDIVVLGLGNLLLSDEGFGVQAIRCLSATDLAKEVELLDGGTGGLTLLGIVEMAHRLLVLDIIDAGLPPGTVLTLKGPEVPRYVGTKLSQHQLGFQEVLALANFRGKLPEEIVIIGIQPHCLEWGCELSAVIKAKLPEVVDLVRQQLETWGINQRHC